MYPGYNYEKEVYEQRVRDLLKNAAPYDPNQVSHARRLLSILRSGVSALNERMSSRDAVVQDQTRSTREVLIER